MRNIGKRTVILANDLAVHVRQPEKQGEDREDRATSDDGCVGDRGGLLGKTK